MKAFDCKNVTLGYDEKIVLRDLSFSIQDSEFVGILGPNGSGKSTLLKLMAGVLKPMSGSIQILDKDVNAYHRKDLAKIVSVLPQETLLDFPFTSLEVVLMGRAPYLKIFGWETARDLEVAEAVMKKTDCWDFAEQDVRSLSGGERERVLLARALAQEPKILLLDEPTTHLDLKHQMETYHLLKSLHESQGLTLIAVLHDLNFAAQSCERILMLSNQSLTGDGPPPDVLTPDKLRDVYGISVICQSHPETGKAVYLPKFG